MMNSRVRRGDEVTIRKGRAPGTAAPKRLQAAAGAYTGAVTGCRGVVIGTEVKDGREVATIAATDLALVVHIEL